MNNDCINALNLMYVCTLILMSFELLLSVMTKAGGDKLPSKLHKIKKQRWAAAAAEEIHVRYAVAAVVAAAAAAVSAVAALSQNQEACLILFSIPEWLWQDFS